MRLLNSTSLEVKQFLGDGIPTYAILSHTWREEEVTFQDMQKPGVQNMAGYSKILGCCEQAKLDGSDWVWVGTCCIDKTSSAELSEAINFHICMELIAPSKIEFYSASWTDIGTKWSLHNKIEKIIAIPAEVLLKKSDLAPYTVAQKMSWASNRQTTRQEDRAYCLLGIFRVSMPLLYGKGIRSFHRLQEEIMRQTEDLSILLWTDSSLSANGNSLGVLALCPSFFPRSGPDASIGKVCNYQGIKLAFLNRGVALKALPHGSTHINPPQMATRGLRIHNFFLKNLSQNTNSWTGCMYEQDYICIKLHPNENRGHLKYDRNTKHCIFLVGADDFESFGLTELYLNTDVRISDRVTRTLSSCPDLEIILCTKCEETLFFVEAVPSIRIYNTSTQSQRFFCPDVPQISLKFKSCRYKSGVTTSQFIVISGLRRPSPWCGIMINYDIDLSSANNAVNENGFFNSCNRILILFHDEQSIGTSDRATSRLPNGRVVYVVAKGSTQPKMVRGPFEGRQSAMYTLYVTLFAGKAGTGSGPLA